MRRYFLLSLAAVLCLIAPGSAAGQPVFSAPCPQGVATPCFQTTTLASGLDFPTTVSWAPDGRMFIAEKFGYVRVVKPDGTLPAHPLIDIHDHLVNTGDRGLLGLAASAPDEQGNIRLYMLYTHGEPTTTTEQIATSTLTWVLVKPNDSIEGGTFSASTGTTVDPTEHTVVGSVTTTPKNRSTCTLGSPNCACPSEAADCLPNEGYTHSIGTVLVDPKDGSLWLGAGDGFNDGAYTEASSAPFHLRSQDPESLVGKVLHVKADGNGFANSPFCASSSDTAHNCSKVYAEGLRNPFRFTLRQVAGVTQPLVGDVGEGNWDELNDVHRGFNGGWPCYEGNVSAGEPYEASTQCKALGTKYDPAFYLFNHYQGGTTQTGGAIVAGPVYTGTTYPSTYQGQVFNTDYVHGWINFRSVEDSVDSLEATHQFLSGDQEGHGAPYVSLQQGPDGNLVAVTIYDDPANPGPASGSVSEIHYVPVDKPPVARATASASCINTETTAPTVKFTGDGSGDPDGDLSLLYHWDFGDGSSSAEANPQHTYSGTGTYEVHLTVTDSKGNVDNAYLTLHIGPGDEPPNATITAPAQGNKYLAGRPILLAGGTTTPPSVQMSWEPVLDHGGTHVHVLGDIPTVSGNAEFTADEFHGADSHYILRFIVNKNGCTTTVSREMFPQTGRYYMNAINQSGQPVIGLPLTFLHSSTPETVPSGTPLAPVYFPAAKNARATVSAPLTWISGGYTYTFADWSDDKPQEHEVHPYEYPAHLEEDPQGLTATYNRSDKAPIASIDSPLDGSTFVSGQPLTIHGSATDAEDGKISGEHMAWKITRHAFGAQTDVPAPNGSTAEFVPDSAGDPNATYTIQLTSTDSTGLASAPATITLHVVQPQLPSEPGEPKSPGTGGGIGGIPKPIEPIVILPPAPTISIGPLKRHPSSLEGTVTDPAGIAEVRIAIRPQRMKGKGCLWWAPKRHRFVRLAQKCSQPSWLKARLRASGGAIRWSVSLGGRLPKGRYVLVVSALDRGGRSSAHFDGDPSGVLVLR